MGSEPPSPTISASSISQPSGISTSGRRQVTGSDEPASIGKLQALRGVHHRLGFLEAVGEVLVVVDRNGAAVLFEDLDALLEEFVARIEDLALLVARIVAVLADDQHGIDGQFVAAAAQRLGDGRIDLEAELLARAPRSDRPPASGPRRARRPSCRACATRRRCG